LDFLLNCSSFHFRS